MKKRIAIQDLRPGMYIAGMDQSWFKTPFLRHKWLVKREDEITLLRSYGIQDVFIDTEKGCNVIEAPHIQETVNPQDVSSDDDTPSPPGLNLGPNPEDIESIAGIPLDGIITNHVDLLSRYLKAYKLTKQ